MQPCPHVVVGSVFCLFAVFVMPSAVSADAGERPPVVLVYARDPLQTPQLTFAELPLPVLGNGLSHAWLTARSCIDAGELSHDKRMHVCSVTASASPDAEGRFAAQPLAADAPASAPDPFAEQMLFYHGASSLQFFARLGLTPARSTAPLQLIANVRTPAVPGAALGSFRDATFLRASAPVGVFEAMSVPRGPVIYFGQDQTVRVAYDAAAIHHEVAHAALAPWLPQRAWFVDAQGTSLEPGAITEALADYFTAAITQDARIGVHASQSAGPRQLRNLNVSLSCPASVVGSVHEDGLVLASALWAARQQLGAALDAAVVHGLRAQRASTKLSTERLLEAVLAALTTQEPKAARTASAIFRERGLTPNCQRVLELGPQQSVSGASGAFQLPAVEKGLPLASSAQQLKVTVPEAGMELEVRMRTGVSGADASHFDPALLVKASPIHWTPAGGHDGTLVLAAEGGREGQLRFVTPAPASHAGTVYLQMVNRGARTGWFDTVRVALRRRP